jgi:predicted RecA/RadA family phage recombinase
MAKNFIQEGKVLDYTAAADITSGQFVLVGAIGAVAITDIANGATGPVQITGVFSVPKAAGAVTQGAKLYWDAANSVLTTTASGNTVVGVAAAPAAGGDARVSLLLNIGL